MIYQKLLIIFVSKLKDYIFEQRMYPKWERGYIVGEMSEANFSIYHPLLHQ